MRRGAAWSVTALLAWTLGCGSHQQVRSRVAIGSVYVAPEAAFSVQGQTVAEELCFKGTPLKVSKDLGPTEFVFRQGYALEFSSLDRIPLWVCEHVTKAQLGTDTKRNDKFLPDPLLKGPHSVNGDYARSGYDIGHQAPAGNQGKDQELQNQTFYMSNMAPQLPQLNRNAWKALETLTRQWVGTYGEAWEFTGPVFYDPKEDESASATGTLAYKTIGKDGVGVPTHFYKIVIVNHAGKWKSIAFVMPNLTTYKPPYRLEQYLRSVTWVEAHTGLKFMPGLTEAERVALEAGVSPMW